MTNNKYKILLVEDDANVRSVVSTMLESADYQVVPAETCALAKTLFASHLPDAVILDLGLPDMDGMEFLSFARRDSLTPVIVLSARSDDQDKVRALDGGANDYVTKPFSSAELLARVRTVLRNYQHRADSGKLPGRPLPRPGPSYRLRRPSGLRPGRGGQALPDRVQHRCPALGALRQDDDLLGHHQGGVGPLR